MKHVTDNLNLYLEEWMFSSSSFIWSVGFSDTEYSSHGHIVQFVNVNFGFRNVSSGFGFTCLAKQIEIKNCTNCFKCCLKLQANLTIKSIKLLILLLFSKIWLFPLYSIELASEPNMAISGNKWFPEYLSEIQQFNH